MYKITSSLKGKKNIIESIVDETTGEIISPKFSNLTRQDYVDSLVYSVEPMTAKEYLNDSTLEEMLTSTDYIAEEKLDGTRSTMHLYKRAIRMFSRRVSVKTDWYSENTDSVPHLRDLEVPETLYNTVLDGEMRIDGREFKDVSSTLNCTWDEAIARQEELGFITFHAFDIIYYKGIYVAKMPLMRRKHLLRKVVQQLNNPYVFEEKYYDDNIPVIMTDKMIRDYMYKNLSEGGYPNLFRTLANNINFTIEEFEMNDGFGAEFSFDIEVDKRTWYEYIIYNGGEGIMLKPKDGLYLHKRGREYTKLKKFDTWDVVILDFIAPTRDYTGKEADNPSAKWNYWYDAEDDHLILESTMTMSEADEQGLLPCTKHYAKDWIGTIKYGVIITEEELAMWKKKNPKDTPEIFETVIPTGKMQFYLVVGECSGIDEETRAHMTANKDRLIGDVIEVGANEIMKTGKLRHPRFIRFREDKSPTQCIWKDHIRK